METSILFYSIFPSETTSPLYQNVRDLCRWNRHCPHDDSVNLAKSYLIKRLTTLDLKPFVQPLLSHFGENVIAKIPGTTLPEFLVVLGAHYDSCSYDDENRTAPGLNR